MLLTALLLYWGGSYVKADFRHLAMICRFFFFNKTAHTRSAFPSSICTIRRIST